MEKDFNHYKKFFYNYIKSFNLESNSKDKDVKEKINLKLKHTKKVVDLCEKITAEESSSEEDIFLSKIIGLFHDIGRIYQLYHYETLNDLNSLDHGDFAVKLLKKEKILKNFSKEDKNVILNAVKYHNKIVYDLPEFNKRTSFFVKIIRDADKIDIYRVFNEFDGYLDFSKDSSKDYSKSKKAILNGKQLHGKNKMTSLYHILLSLSWINEIHFKKSLEILKKRGELEKVLEHLPPGYEDLKGYVLEKLD